ncbi:type 4a pilus biogenesis protein PilO [Candidatus Daviesbacteria bacterium]|nr:type 4a pilus biogenesis protein PilO [Candidatus Daviesbacteria bacterium]
MKNQSTIYSRYFTYIKPISKFPIIKTYGSTIFTLLIMIIFIFFAIKPTIETILVLQKKLENYDEIQKKVEQKANDLSQGKQNYDNLDENLKIRLQNAIPDSADISSIISNIEQITKSHNASISAIQIQPIILTPRDEKIVGTLAEVNFTVNIEGFYPGLVAILQDLRLSSRLFSIENLTINKLTEGSGLILSISGKAYYIK